MKVKKVFASMLYLPPWRQWVSTNAMQGKQWTRGITSAGDAVETEHSLSILARRRACGVNSHRSV